MSEIAWFQVLGCGGLLLAVLVHALALEEQFAADQQPLPRGWWE